jgi:hypothetical protein
MDIIGINGATAQTNAGVEHHKHNGSFTMHATIWPYEIPFKETYIDHTIYDARQKFKAALQIETDKYIA